MQLSRSPDKVIYRSVKYFDQLVDNNYRLSVRIILIYADNVILNPRLKSG